MTEVDFRGLGKCWLQFSPPVVVKGAHLFDLLGVFSGKILFLTGVIIDVIELITIYQSPSLRHYGGLAPFDGVPDSLGICNQKSIRPALVITFAEQFTNRNSIEFESWRNLGGSTEVEESWDNVDKGCESVDGPFLVKVAGGPVHKEWNPVSSIVFASL